MVFFPDQSLASLVYTLKGACALKGYTEKSTLQGCLYPVFKGAYLLRRFGIENNFS